MQSVLSKRRFIVDFVKFPNKHCYDNSKQVSTEMPVLDKHSAAVLWSIAYG
jgi:hypothetical protein